MSYHGSVEPVFRHYGAVTPALLLLAPFGSAVLKPNLNSVLWQLDFHGEGLSGINVRIMAVFKSFLQFFQLVICEDCPMSSFLRSVVGGSIFQHTF